MCMYVCVCICMYVCLFACTYIHIYTIISLVGFITLLVAVLYYRSIVALPVQFLYYRWKITLPVDLFHYRSISMLLAKHYITGCDSRVLVISKINQPSTWLQLQVWYRSLYHKSQRFQKDVPKAFLQRSLHIRTLLPQSYAMAIRFPFLGHFSRVFSIHRWKCDLHSSKHNSMSIDSFVNNHPLTDEDTRQNSAAWTCKNTKTVYMQQP